jgi:F-box/leucine-rich repeat protein 2/20
MTRPRKGRRAYEVKRLKYLDARDGYAEEMKIGQDECDEKKVVLQTFYSWQTVDAVKAAREKKKRGRERRAVNETNGSMTDVDEGVRRSTRWWSPGNARRNLRGVRAAGGEGSATGGGDGGEVRVRLGSPSRLLVPDDVANGEGCVIA